MFRSGSCSTRPRKAPPERGSRSSSHLRHLVHFQSPTSPAAPYVPAGQETSGSRRSTSTGNTGFPCLTNNRASSSIQGLIRPVTRITRASALSYRLRNALWPRRRLITHIAAGTGLESLRLQRLPQRLRNRCVRKCRRKEDALRRRSSNAACRRLSVG